MLILLAQNDSRLADHLQNAVQGKSVALVWTNDASAARRMLDAGEFDLAIMDRELRSKDSLALIADLRKSGSQIPIMVVTAGDSLAIRILCLNGGADDVIASPFTLAELEARLRAVIRRCRVRDSSDRILQCGDLSFNRNGRLFYSGETMLALTPRERAMLEALMERAGKVVPKEALFNQVFSGGDDIRLKAIDVLILRLRRKLEPTSVEIQNVRGLGYQLVGHA
jgi:DNA-binding response OmpR family regulator